MQYLRKTRQAEYVKPSKTHPDMVVLIPADSSPDVVQRAVEKRFTFVAPKGPVMGPSVRTKDLKGNITAVRTMNKSSAKKSLRHARGVV
jgi:hypothetical protein